MPIHNIAGDMESHNKSTQWDTNNKKAPEVNFFDILRIQKKVGYPEYFSEIFSNDGKEQEPYQ